jgi:hypothetical protein
MKLAVRKKEESHFSEKKKFFIWFHFEALPPDFPKTIA